MEEKVLSEKESLALIAEMIQKTKRRFPFIGGEMFLFWGYLSVLVAVLVFWLGYTMKYEFAYWLWFLIPAVGFPVTYVQHRRERGQATAKSYVDRIIAGVWNFVRTLSIVFMLLCFVFMLCGYNTWLLMLLFAFEAIGFGAAVTGVVIQERSFVFGGILSMTAGALFTCFIICGIPVQVMYVMLLYGVSFIFTLIVPGHILNYKAKHSCLKN